MAVELSYILTTPYTIVKSRTGGVLSRLLSRLDLELVAAQMIAPSQELAEEYAESMVKYESTKVPASAKLLHDYILRTIAPTNGRRHRVVIFLFKGENAIQKLMDIAGALYPENRSIESLKGETIRDTYGDLIFNSKEPGSVSYFEPAVLTPHSKISALKNLEMFANFAASKNNLIQNVRYENPSKIERTLVIIKPDNWRYPSLKPGTIIDMFARTGLRIIGCKLYQMSVDEALEFYGSVRDVLEEKLSPLAGKWSAEILGKKFSMNIEDNVLEGLTQSFGKAYAEEQFFKIVEFMSGTRPDACDEKDSACSGKVKSMILVYEGENAIKKIRDVLGPTDPTKAPGGTVRREFGSDVMINTAHASDSIENAEREMKIVQMEKNNLSSIIFEYFKTQK